MSEHVDKFMMDASLPSLDIHWPSCGQCGEDVEIEDGIASCRRCLVQWDRIDEDAEACPDPNLEGTDVPCGIVSGIQRGPWVQHHDTRTFTPGPLQPCILPSGHEGAHLCPYEMTVSHASQRVDGVIVA